MSRPMRSSTATRARREPRHRQPIDRRARREVAGRAMERLLAVVLLIGFAAWSALVATGRTARLDAVFARVRPLLPRSAGAQIAEAV